MSQMDDAIPRSILLIAFVISGGFFSGAETAFSYTNTVRIKMMSRNSRRARVAAQIIEDFDMTVVTLLIIINAIHITASAVATSLFIDLTGNAATGTVTATVVITLAIFIFSEAIPKNFAKTNSDAYALYSAIPVKICTAVFFPLAKLLTLFGEGVKKLFKLQDNTPSVTEDEFSAMVDNAGEEDIFEPEETEIIQSAIEFGDTKVSEIMTPCEKTVAISVKADANEIKQILLSEKYSRFPVYRGSINNIVGTVRANKVLWKMINGDNDFDIKSNMTKPLFCTPGDSAGEVFERMCNRKNHFAVVRDGSSKTVGIITMEDILEEIVGEIYDEDDFDETEGKTDE